MTPAFSVIVPVLNEGANITKSVLNILDGLPETAELIFICNGCTDDSEAKIRASIGKRGIVVVTERGKAKAIRLGESRATLLPRFYVDSDIGISGSALVRLADTLALTNAELVSPRTVFNLDGASHTSILVNRLFLQLPHARTGAFNCVLGVSAAGRARWGEFPDLIADDAFIEAMIPEERKHIAQDVEMTVRPPRTVLSILRVRIRIARGQRQLQSLGMAIPHVRGQYRAVLAAWLQPDQFLAASLYIAIVALAKIAARLPSNQSTPWYQDQTSR